MKFVSRGELRRKSGALLREVQSGQTLIVTKSGAPIAELRPIELRRFVPRSDIAEAAKRALRIDAQRFRMDIEANIDQRADG